MRDTDQKKKLVEYFIKNLQKGYTEDALKFALVRQSYSRIVVEEALRDATKEMALKAPILSEKPVIKYEAVEEEKPVKKSFLKKFFGSD